MIAFLAERTEIPSILDPGGPAAARVETIWWVMFWIAALVVAIVTGLVIASVIRTRLTISDEDVDRTEIRWGDRFITIAGVVLPVLILGGVFLYSLREMNELAKPASDTTLTVEVVAHDWWWEARYDNGAVTANEIHIPAGEPVRLELTTADVIHSFWVPRLQVKVDQIPGRTTSLWIEADEPGRYRGQCAEFCGLQHANMAFFVVAEAPADFEDWLEDEGEDAVSPFGSAGAGEDVFLDGSCFGCHAIRGTKADSPIGPDLTHLASRDTIAAGTLANTRENLERFILDPQGVKPGNAMPPTELSEEELTALLDYLEQLD